jgi:CO dehydrogenase/acetyl-CoA synthase delta subunit
MENPSTAPAPPRKAGPRLFRRGPWEILATVLIACGVLMLLQPFAIELYTWSFAVTLAGVALFTVVSKFPE